MRKTLLFNLFFVASACTLAAQDYPMAQWGNLFGGAKTSGDQSTAIATTTDGSVIWLNTANTDATTPDVYYNDAVIYTNPVTANNLSILCTAQDGTLKWEAHSTTTDAMSSQGNVVVDNEGNIIISAKVRQAEASEMNLIDAAGTETKYGEAYEKKFYQIMIAKLSEDGNVKWVKLLNQSTAPAPAAAGSNADFTSDAVSSTALTVDNDGNIYVGGNYRTDITIDGVTLHPNNVSTWAGDSQSACGNMFVIKLDKDGAYKASLVSEGEINGVSQVQALEWNDNQLYVYGYAKGEGDLNVAGVKLTPSDTNSMIIASLNADFSANWAKCFQGAPVDGKSALQNVGMSIYGDNLWLCGQFNQKITDADDAEKYVVATQGSLREGFIIMLNKKTGEWLASADSRVDFPEITKLSGYLKVIQNTECLDNAYVYGYTMDAAQGVFIRQYNAQTLEPNTECAWNIATGGGVPSAVAIAYDQTVNSIYVTARGNKAFTLMGEPSITTDATKSWDILMAKYTMPEPKTSAINALESDNSEASAAIYDITGRYVGKEKTSLTPGIYITANKKFIVR